MIYVKQVRSNLKRGCHLTLGPKTVLVGQNGAGKSTVLQSIELALRGSVSDVEGRDGVQQPKALGRLFPAGVEPEVECVLSDGTVFHWRMHRDEDGSCKEPKALRPVDIAWPFQEIQEILSGNSTNIAAWLEKQVVGGMTLDQLLSSVPPEVRSEVTTLQRQMGTTDFMALAKAAKDEARTLRTGATKQEKTIDHMVQGIEPPLSEDDRRSMQARLDEIEAQTGNITAAELVELKQEVDSLVTAYLSAKQTVEQMTEVPPSAFSAVERLRSAKALISDHDATFGNDSCWVCGNSDPVSIAAHRGKLEAVSTTLQDYIRQASAHQSARYQLEMTQAKLEKAVTRLKGAKVQPDHRHEAAQLRNQLASDAAARKTWLNAESSRRSALQARVRADHLTTAGKVLSEAGKAAIELRKDQFEKGVTAYLPPGDRFVLDIDNGRVGLFREGQLHSAVSGAEWMRVLMALASTMQAEQRPALIAPPDRAWDRSTLTLVMHALKDAPCQILLMSAIEPWPVKGWDVVQVGT